MPTDAQADKTKWRFQVTLPVEMKDRMQAAADSVGLDKSALAEKWIREGLERQQAEAAQADVLPQLQTMMQGLVYGELVRFFREMPLFEGMLAHTVAAHKEAGIAHVMTSSLFRLLVEHTPPLPCPRCGFKEWPDRASIARRQEQIAVAAVEHAMVEDRPPEMEP